MNQSIKKPSLFAVMVLNPSLLYGWQYAYRIVYTLNFPINCLQEKNNKLNHQDLLLLFGPSPASKKSLDFTQPIEPL